MDFITKKELAQLTKTHTEYNSHQHPTHALQSDPYPKSTKKKVTMLHSRHCKGGSYFGVGSSWVFPHNWNPFHGFANIKAVTTKTKEKQ